MSLIIEVDDHNYEQVLSSNTLVVMNFCAEWSAPCRMLAPTLDELASKYEGRMVVANVNIDDSPRCMSAFGIRSVPTTIFFNGGRKVDQLQGALPESFRDKFYELSQLSM